jgi:hypothetical protein
VCTHAARIPHQLFPAMFLEQVLDALHRQCSDKGAGVVDRLHRGRKADLNIVGAVLAERSIHMHYEAP